MFPLCCMILRRLLATATTRMTSLLPKVVVFDLDGCVWDPEMYELWGSGGAPFKVRKDGNLSDRSGTVVRLLGDVKNIMTEFKTDSKWSDAIIAVASSCDEPGWARECIQKFPLGEALRNFSNFDYLVKSMQSEDLTHSHRLLAVYDTV